MPSDYRGYLRINLIKPSKNNNNNNVLKKTTEEKSIKTFERMEFVYPHILKEIDL